MLHTTVEAVVQVVILRLAWQPFDPKPKGNEREAVVSSFPLVCYASTVVPESSTNLLLLAAQGCCTGQGEQTRQGTETH